MDRRQKELLITNIVRGLGTSLKNRGIYPANHPQVRTPVEKVHKDLLLVSADRNELALAIADGTIVLEGVPIFNLNSSLESFMDRLTKIGVPALVIQKGITLADIENFVRFLHETKDQGLDVGRIQELLDRFGAGHIRVKPMDEDADDRALAHELYDNAVAVVSTVLKEVRLGRIPSGAESERVVREMGTMLTRNRDALLALTIIKNFDEYTYTHSVNVSVLSLALADAMGLPGPEKISVGVAGLLHDIGKTQLALDLIRKPTRLSVEEFEEIKKHPEEGFVLLGKMSHIAPDSAVIVREHHMRYDRTGYPRPEPGHRMHPHSGIIPVADSYDALTTMRSYQNARTPQQALDVMVQLAGKSLNREIVATFVKTMGKYPIGSMVRLDTMEVGIVAGPGTPGKDPQNVIVLFDRNGNSLPRPERIDLQEKDALTGRPRRAILGSVNPRLFPAPPPEVILSVAAS
jgi:putative nucleotidyltransferase with HDIG domain